MADVERSREVHYEGRGSGAPSISVPLQQTASPAHSTSWKQWGVMVALGAVVVEVALVIDRKVTGGGKFTSGPVLTVTAEPMSAAYPSTTSSYASGNPIGLTPTPA